MKTGKLEKWLLLEQSGELSPRRLRRLGRELAASDKTRRLRAELNMLNRSVRPPEVEPSSWTVARINARLREEKQTVINLSRVLKPVPALAAGLALVLGVWNFHGNLNSSASTAVVAAAEVDVWNDPLEEDMNRLENLITAISGDPLNSMEM